MKKFVLSIISAIVLVLFAFPAFAIDIDLSGLSYDELVSLRERVNIKILDNENWDEVEVPQGVYQIWPHIPSGHYTIFPKDGLCTSIGVGTTLNSTQSGLDYTKHTEGFALYSKSYSAYQDGDMTSGDIDLRSGMYIEISNGPAIFTPYNGKPVFEFKNNSSADSVDDSYYAEYLTIEDLQVYKEGENVYIEGTVRNAGPNTVDYAKYRCSFLDSGGESVAVKYAHVTDIKPDSIVVFKVSAPYDSRMTNGRGALIDVYLGGKV